MYEVQLETLMLIPMFLLVFFTLVSLLRLAMARINSVLKNEVPVGYYKDKVAKNDFHLPEKLTILDNHFKNLLELPVLYYIGCIMIIVLGKIDVLDVVLSWCFLGSRLIHSTIFITYNNVTHRLMAYLLGYITVFILWGNLFYNFIF